MGKSEDEETLTVLLTLWFLGQGVSIMITALKLSLPENAIEKRLPIVKTDGGCWILMWAVCLLLTCIYPVVFLVWALKRIVGAIQARSSGEGHTCCGISWRRPGKGLAVDEEARYIGTERHNLENPDTDGSLDASHDMELSRYTP